MKLLFVTLFPEFIADNFSHSMLKRGKEAGALEVMTVDPRQFTADRHRSADDTPFGGGAGMLLKPEPFIAAVKAAKTLLPGAPALMLSPAGRRFCQEDARVLAQENGLIFLCGHYEGFDERIAKYADQAFSIGDYVLTGGELPAVVMSDAICRLLPGVLGKLESTEEESFADGFLEYPQYTRPASMPEGDVPAVLLSGDHSRIKLWRRKEALRKTWLQRPELLRSAGLKAGDGELLLEIINEQDDDNL